MDNRIDKLVKGNPCHKVDHDFPEIDLTKFGYGTIAHCGRCGIKAKLESDQREGDIWVYLYPQEYAEV